jgi:hypothetical protein
MDDIIDEQFEISKTITSAGGNEKIIFKSQKELNV